MFRGQLAEREPGFRVAVIRRIAEFLEGLAQFSVGRLALNVGPLFYNYHPIPAPFKRNFN